MKLYLVRHGQACEPHVDPERGLTDRGKSDVEKVGAAVARKGVTVSRTLHSPKKRARETAELLASASWLPATSKKRTASCPTTNLGSGRNA